MKIGFIGLGNVGGKLAGSLLRNKFNLTVIDIDENLLLVKGCVPGFSGSRVIVKPAIKYKRRLYWDFSYAFKFFRY